MIYFRAGRDLGCLEHLAVRLILCPLSLLAALQLRIFVFPLIKNYGKLILIVTEEHSGWVGWYRTH